MKRHDKKPIEDRIASHIPQEKAMAMMAEIRERKLSGSLVINFSQGTPAGGVQWAEAEHPGDNPP